MLCARSRKFLFRSAGKLRYIRPKTANDYYRHFRFSNFRRSQKISKMDETISSEKSSQIKLTLSASETIQSPPSGTKSPPQNRQQLLLPQSTAAINLNANCKCDISLETGSATGMN